MAGIRIGGTTILTLCSPPFGAEDAPEDNSNIYVWCSTNAAGDANNISGFSDDGATIGLAFDAVLSPDGTKILFCANNPDTGFNDIWVVNANGGTSLRLLQDDNEYYMTPMWGPDSDLFVCVHGSGGSFNGSVETSRVSNPGVVIDTLVTQDGTSSPFRPSYNSDGSRIAYWWNQQDAGGCELRVMDDDGTNDALLDTITNYRFSGAQKGWANAQDTLVYEDGAAAPAAAYVINGDGTGKTQVNASGDAATGGARVAHIAWPADDSYVVVGSQVWGLQWTPTRCELDGSGSTALDSSHGAVNTAGDQQSLVYGGRAWFLQQVFSVGKLASVALDGTDYQVNLNTSLGSTMSEILGGWYGDAG